MRLTARGRALVSWASVSGFILVLGFAGWIEGL
jgi:hypothetical protein